MQADVAADHRRPDRWLPHLAVAICLLAPSPAVGGESGRDLAAAFTATYQQPPPLVRTIDQPIYADGRIDHMLYNESAVLAAARLVKQHGRHYALLVSETVQDVGHAHPGSSSIAYLTLDRTWHLERLWPELATMEETGIPADRISSVRFGAEPLILASSTYCGMGACGETISVFAVGQDAPRVLGALEGGFDNNNESRAPSCPRQRYTATIAAPRIRTDAFSVIYAGWTTGESGTGPKRLFRRRVDYVDPAKGLVPASPQRPWCW